MPEASGVVYLIRHGWSAGNETPHVINGRRNELPLTSKGEWQSDLLGSWMRLYGLLPDYVESSPAVRAMRTGERALQAAGIEKELVIVDALQEIDMGEVTGRLRAEVYTEEVLDRIKKLGSSHRHPGGESLDDVGTRMLDHLENLPRDGVTVAFGHGLAIRCLAGMIHGWSQQRILNTPIPNTSITQFTYEFGGWQLGEDWLGAVPHLPEDLVTL